jgi:hypothetical protein
MGDRANIEVREGDNSIYLYTHWHGCQTPGMLHRALHRGRERWTHPEYLARIIFCEMVRGNEMDVTGFGISSTETWASKHILVDTDAQTVTIDGGEPVSFEDYLAAPIVGEESVPEAEAAEPLAAVAVSKETIIATAAEYEFSSFVNDFYWHNDDDDLFRIVCTLSEKLRKAAPVLEPGSDKPADRHGLTDQDYAYSANFWRHWHRSPIIDAIQKKNWSLVRVHKEMVTMLRALIALDATGELREWNVTDATGHVRDIEQGRSRAFAVMTAELDRLSRYETEGHMFRYGTYLALKILDEEKTPCRDFAKRIADELGASDPMYRKHQA